MPIALFCEGILAKIGRWLCPHGTCVFNRMAPIERNFVFLHMEYTDATSNGNSTAAVYEY